VHCQAQGTPCAYIFDTKTKFKEKLKKTGRPTVKTLLIRVQTLTMTMISPAKKGRKKPDQSRGNTVKNYATPDVTPRDDKPLYSLKMDLITFHPDINQ